MSSPRSRTRRRSTPKPSCRNSLRGSDHVRTESRRRRAGWRAERAALDRAALARRQHHPRQRHRLGPAALGLHERGLRLRGLGRFRRHPPARAEICRHSTGLHRDRAAPRGQGARRRERGSPHHGARQLFHGGGALGRGAVDLPRRRRGEQTPQREEARVLRPVREVRRSPHRAGLSAVRRQDHPGLVPPAAGLQRRQDPGGDLVPGHGHVQGAVRGAAWRPLAHARRRGARARRPGPGGMPRARPHGEHAELDGRG